MAGSSGNDDFYRRPTHSEFSGSGFYHRMEGFDYVEADVSADGGGYDVEAVDYLFTPLGEWQLD